ncbi:MAG: DUF502 domain-containing protein [Candidatus Krumholzibacteriota bacterium]|nr:DUF502 domain-containing protein [Candidatus Krumholzibacteriota bacterium]
MRRARRWLLTGLAVTLPTVITGWVLWKLFSAFDALLNPWVQARLGFSIPGLGFVAVVILLMVIGALASNLMVARVIRFFERLLNRVPLVGRIYLGVKQILGVFVSDRQTVAFQSVVRLEFPRAGVWALGFISRESPPLSDAADEGLVNVFLPTSPNPTSGFFLMVSRNELRPTGLSVEEALKVIVSGGAYAPSGSPPAPQP